ncbi:Hypothetical protein SCF082_LOCUS27543 [Durusdinium trenchii]|uniref:Uncharacterized protein n=1 Tax=Durusdinium trenchii TaxID=1381693 RepID=A0ABP0ME08_9DINO
MVAGERAGRGRQVDAQAGYLRSRCEGPTIEDAQKGSYFGKNAEGQGLPDKKDGCFITAEGVREGASCAKKGSASARRGTTSNSRQSNARLRHKLEGCFPHTLLEAMTQPKTGEPTSMRRRNQKAEFDARNRKCCQSHHRARRGVASVFFHCLDLDLREMVVEPIADSGPNDEQTLQNLARKMAAHEGDAGALEMGLTSESHFSVPQQMHSHGATQVQRQQKVYEALGGVMPRIHALSLVTRTPEETDDDGQ